MARYAAAIRTTAAMMSSLKPTLQHIGATVSQCQTQAEQSSMCDLELITLAIEALLGFSEQVRNSTGTLDLETV